MSKKLSRELIAQKVKSDRIESIRNLNLWGSNIEDISIIEEMPSLEIVSLSVNKIRTLRPFANLQNLKELYLRRNLIANLNEIKYLTDCHNLSVLWLSENPICDNPNYRAVVICVLPQLQKLDDIAITDEERDRAEQKLSGKFEKEDDAEEEDVPEPEEDNKKYQQQQKQREEEEEQRYSPKKKSNNNNANNNNFSRKKSQGYNGQNDYNNDEGYYGNNNVRKSIQKKNAPNRNQFEQDDDDEDYIKPKKTFQPTRHKNEYERYDIKDYKKSNNYDYEDKYGEKNYGEKKKGNSNVLNCVISLLKELSPNELQIVKREIDRINNY
jgi:hypothetical protein